VCKLLISRLNRILANDKPDNGSGLSAVLCQMRIVVCSGTHQVGRDDELGVHLALRIYFETDCPPTNEALEQQEGNSRDTGDDFRWAFELVTASGWFYLHGLILKQSA